MHEYGFAYRIRQSTELEVYHTPVHYADWIRFFVPESRYVESSIRYLVQRYCTRAYLIENGVRSEQLAADSLLVRDSPAYSQAFLIEVVDSIITKTTFDKGNEFAQDVDGRREFSTTLIGTYDFFIFLYLGPESYLSLLEADDAQRAQIIAMLERQTGISVRERFDTAVRNNIGIDLTKPARQYQGDLKRLQRNRPGIEGQTDVSPLDPKTLEAVTQCRQALAQDLLAGATAGKKKTFDFASDQRAYAQFEHDEVDDYPEKGR